MNKVKVEYSLKSQNNSELISLFLEKYLSEGRLCNICTDHGNTSINNGNDKITICLEGGDLLGSDTINSLKEIEKSPENFKEDLMKFKEEQRIKAEQRKEEFNTKVKLNCAQNINSVNSLNLS